jgi:hypothetical protein
MYKANATEDLKEILTTGFLKCKTLIGDTPIILKSITPFEREAIEDRSWSKSDSERHLAAVLTLCYGVYMLDGVNLLPYRDDVIQELKSRFLAVPEKTLEGVGVVIWWLNNRLRETTTEIEDFVDTPESSYLWEIFQHSNKIDGMDKVGLSIPTQYWVVAMTAKEQNKWIDAAHDIGIMVGSFFSPKAAKQLYQSKQAKEDNRQEERKLVRELKAREKGPQQLTKPITTNEDLMEQLQNQVAGVRDEHDITVEKWEQETWNKMVSERERQIHQQLEKYDGDSPFVTSKEEFLDLNTLQYELSLRKKYR